MLTSASSTGLVYAILPHGIGYVTYFNLVDNVLSAAQIYKSLRLVGLGLQGQMSGTAVQVLSCQPSNC